jgi:diguanylate cyclase (GGDEF)-like protein
LIQIDALRDLLGSLPPAVGQRILRKIASTIQTDLRAHDIVGRVSPSRFGVLLPGTPPAGAELVLQRIRHMLAAPIQLEDGETIEINPRVSVVSHQGEETARQMMERAELGLEQAPNASGVNRP